MDPWADSRCAALTSKLREEGTRPAVAPNSVTTQPRISWLNRHSLKPGLDCDDSATDLVALPSQSPSHVPPRRSEATHSLRSYNRSHATHGSVTRAVHS